VPEDGTQGIKVPVETLGGKPLTVMVTTGGVTLQDNDPKTPDAHVVRAIQVR